MSRALGLSWNKLNLRNSTHIAAVMRPICKLLNAQLNSGFPQGIQREIFAVRGKDRVNFDRSMCSVAVASPGCFAIFLGWAVGYDESPDSMSGAIHLNSLRREFSRETVPESFHAKIFHRQTRINTGR